MLTVLISKPQGTQEYDLDHNIRYIVYKSFLSAFLFLFLFFPSFSLEKSPHVET